MAIVLQNLSPMNGEANVDAYADIQVDISGASTLAGLEVFVEGTLAFSGSLYPNPFHPPFAGPASSVSFLVDGYRVTLDRTIDSPKEFVNVQVRQNDGYGLRSVPVAGWSFRVGDDPINDFYFSDGPSDSDGLPNPEPGVRRLHVRRMVGEWKPHDRSSDGYAMPVVLSQAVTPGWPSDRVNSLSANMIDGYLFLVASTQAGAAITRNETADLRIYADGYDGYCGHMTAGGTLYLVNRTLNRLEVFYGSDFRSGNRPPDFVYDDDSTPPLLGGQLTTLHVAEGHSTVFQGGSRLYVGCSNGLTKIEAYDKEDPDGYCAGMDEYGRSYTYGISGSATDFGILGGTVSNVVAVDSDETGGVLLVATNDGTETGGGLSQISISRNTRLLFMTRESGHLPSNVIRSIAGA